MLAVGLALTAAALALTSRPGPATGDPTRPVVVADRDLPAGTVLTAEHLRLTAVEGSGAGTHEQTSEVIGRIVVGGLAAGEPVTDHRLLDGAKQSGVPPGMVPLVIPITDAATLAPLRAGMCVDVWAGSLGSPLQQVADDGFLIGVLDTSAPESGSIAQSGQYPRSHAVIGVTPTDSIGVLEALSMDVFLATVCPAHD